MLCACDASFGSPQHPALSTRGARSLCVFPSFASWGFLPVKIVFPASSRHVNAAAVTSDKGLPGEM